MMRFNHLTGPAVEAYATLTEGYNDLCKELADAALKEADELVADVARQRDAATHQVDVWHEGWVETTAQLTECERELESLKVCGNCDGYYLDPYGECDSSCATLAPLTTDGTPDPFANDWPQHSSSWGVVEPHDNCHWAVSRWQPRGGK